MIKIKTVIGVLCIFAVFNLNAQILTIDDCYQLANDNFPVIKQYELIEKTKDFSIENAQKALLPQFGIYGQASYQSEVVRFPFDFANVPVAGLSDMKMPTLSKDQYRLYGELSYSLTDLITNKNRIDLVKANAEIESQKIEVELYKLRERINSLFFGILLIDAQIVQTELVKKDIQNGIAIAETSIANGVAIKSAADNLKAELLKVKQRVTEMSATRKGYAEMLSLFIGQKIDENTVFEQPVTKTVSHENNRPEIRLFDMQNRAFELHDQMITNKNLPRVSLFFQGGFGKPALNILSDNFDPYYITGLRLSWNLSGYYYAKNERKQIAINQSGVQIQRETFLFNTNLAISQQNTEIAKMQELVADDDEIIRLRETVKKAAQTQLENGTATTNDYMIAVNAEDQARQNRILHEIQFIMAQYNAQTTIGNTNN